MHTRILALLAFAALALLSKDCTSSNQAHIEKSCGSAGCSYTQFDNEGKESRYAFCPLNDQACNANPFNYPVPEK